MLADRLEPDAVAAAIDRRWRRSVASVECFAEVDSTNRLLLERPAPAAGFLTAALAEFQRGGRGRRGRRWNMPPGSGIALSTAFRYPRLPEALTAFSLGVGAAVRRAINDVCAYLVGLKWPNDLVVDGGKLGGVLVELDRLEDGGVHVVAGIGINVRVPEAVLATLSEWPEGARDLERSTGAPVDRAALAGALIGRLAELFLGFGVTGFEPYRAEWLQAHVLHDREVEIRANESVDVGKVRGIETDGALLVEDGAGRSRRIVSGDVSLRTRA